MEQRVINPWKWQDQFGFAQATEVKGATRTLYVAGQAAIDADGHPAHAGDMGAQVKLALDNLETVLKQSGYNFAHVVRLNVYTTDVDALVPHWGQIVERVTGAGGKFACFLGGVKRLAFPELMVEIEATAAQ
jgi:enamine deaminase RidA (YjgF/YER057c/UK114 family)